MKNRKPVVVMAVLAVVALAVLVGVWRSASAAYITSQSIVYGNQGIFIPGGFSSENVSLDRIAPREFRGATLVFKRPLLDLEFRNSGGGRVNIPFAMTYVFFVLSPGENRQFEKGQLGIYYKDLTTGFWRSCYTAAVASGTAEEPTTTLACVAPQATIFGLGKPRSE
jgi:hypothetical protein